MLVMVGTVPADVHAQRAACLSREPPTAATADEPAVRSRATAAGGARAAAGRWRGYGVSIPTTLMLHQHKARVVIKHRSLLYSHRKRKTVCLMPTSAQPSGVCAS
ncbi:hypothetical protein HaLaN_04236, partial [Haematococcus lacustris]